MLPSTEQNNPNAVETFFCKPFEQLPEQELNKEQAQMFFAIKQANEDVLPMIEKYFTKAYWWYPAIEKRLNVMFTYTMDARARMILCSWSESVGDIAIYLTYIQYLCKKNNIKHINLDTLTNLFPNGAKDREVVRGVWEMQKVKKGDNGTSDNLIDYRSAMQSILF
jgi:hypothetical protein